MSGFKKVIVYVPNQRLKTNILTSTVNMINNTLSSKELVAQLFKRDFFASYKKSFIGLSWIFISPIIGVISWIFMNSVGVLSPGDVGMPYPAYVLISNSIWGAFMGFYNSGLSTLSAGSSFIMQVKYPHEVLLVKQVAEFLATFLLGFIFNILVLLVMGVVPSWKIIFFPVVILPLFFLGAGIGMVLSVINVVAMDISKGMGYLLGLVFFVTPVVYSPQV
jgi:ABC-type polysaccharide/polyol phosphate export permease